MMEKEELTREQTRMVDKLAIEQFGIPSVVLMENAGYGIAHFLLSQKPKGKVIICCGKGNNGGDGYVIARYLYIYRISVQIILFAKEDEIKGDAKINYNIIKKMGIEIEYLPYNTIDQTALINKLNSAEWIVDGLFGTGLTGKLEKFYLDIIDTINKADSKILSVDIPSGLDCDTGDPLGTAIRANYTCTLISLKKGFKKPQAQKYLGKIKVIDIGIPLVAIISQIKSIL